MDELMGTQAWSDEESAVLVWLYFGMLDLELKDKPYKKSEINRLVQEATGRSKGSIEFKFCNISSVLSDLGLPYVWGYKPRSHVQTALRVLVEEEASRVFPGDMTSPPMEMHIGPADSMPNSLNLRASSPVLERSAHSREGYVLTDVNSDTPMASGFWERCDGLWDRATGGTDVAATPNEDVTSIWPTSQRPAGVGEACDWIREAIDNGLTPRLLFLVGGPGAGKSHATAQVTAGLRPIGAATDGLAHRLYRYSGPCGDLAVVNDATIVQDAGNSTALATDISNAVNARSHFMACINRGILVEESAHVAGRPDAEHEAGDIVTLWLHGELTGRTASSGWEISDQHQTQFHWQGTLRRFGNVVANVMAVFVDVCSLFELRPRLKSNQEPDPTKLKFTQYRVEFFQDRPMLDDAEMPAADLLVSVLDVVGAAETQSDSLDSDPISANVESLGSHRVRSGLLTVARAAEVAASSRMTYRELWGFLVRSIVGNAPAEVSRGQLRAWIAENQPTGTDEWQRFVQMQKLASLRFSQAIFGADGNSSSSNAAASNPVLKFMRLVDPVRDAIPGNNQAGGQSGWATPLSEAFSGHVSSNSPLEVLRGAAPDSAFADAVGAFDIDVDRAYINLMSSQNLTEKRRFEAMSWYGTYLTRLYAVSLGIPAFRAQLSMWVNAWRHVPYLPDGLDKPLKALIRPKRDPDASHSSSLIPVFDSRTEAIIGRVNPPKLALRFGQIELKTRLKDEGVLLDWGEDGKVMGSVALDFALVREAMACSDEHAGVTDFIDTTAPRLERIRAARLVTHHLKNAQFGLIFGDKDVQLTISKRGQ